MESRLDVQPSDTHHWGVGGEVALFYDDHCDVYHDDGGDDDDDDEDDSDIFPRYVDCQWNMSQFDSSQWDNGRIFSMKGMTVTHIINLLLLRKGKIYSNCNFCPEPCVMFDQYRYKLYGENICMK